MVARIGLKGARPVKTYFAEWREWKGWTQQELADRMETTAATVSRVETGERDWGKGYLEAFSYVIGCPNPADPISRPPGAAITLDDMLRDVGPEIRRQAFAVVETLVRTGTGTVAKRHFPPTPSEVQKAVEAHVPDALRTEIESALRDDPRRMTGILQVVREIGAQSRSDQGGDSEDSEGGKAPDRGR